MSQIRSRIGRYRQIELIDRGEFISTFLARDTRLARNVTIRISNQKLNRVEYKVFLNQARLIAQQDPRTAGIHVIDFAVYNDRPYLVLTHHPPASTPREVPDAHFFELDIALIHQRWIRLNKWILVLLLTLQTSMFIFAGVYLTKFAFIPLLPELPVALLLVSLFILLILLQKRNRRVDVTDDSQQPEKAATSL